MSELLIRVVDKINADPYKDCKCLKRGDVVVICPDGWGWSSEELSNPDWRILKLPNVPLATAQAFLGPELDTDPANPSHMLRRRAFLIDLANAAIPAAMKTWIADVSRAAPTRTVNFTPAQFLALKQAKTALADPNVIG